MKLRDQIFRTPLRVAFGSARQSGGLTSVDLAATTDETRVILTASDGSAAPVDGADPARAGVMTAADKTKLDGLAAGTTRELPARSDVPGTTVGTSVTHIRTVGYAVPGDGGGAFYRRVTSEPAHNLKVQSADGAWWEFEPDSHGYVNIRQAGAVGDDTTDDSQAILDALDFADLNTVGQDTATYGVIVPPGNYYLGSTTVQLKKAVHILGPGNGFGAGVNPTRLRWDANVTGIIVHRWNTIDATTESDGTQRSADGSRIEGLWLQGGGGTAASLTDDTKGHGIWLRARAEIRDVQISDFAGNGIHVFADTNLTAAEEGNANNWAVFRATIRGCHGNGLFTDGNNVNAGIAINVDCSLNGRWGFHDSSLLGNTYIACHTSGNGLSGRGENPAGSSSRVAFGGRHYAANVNASEAALAATQPGTDEDVWIDQGTGSASGAIPAWQSGQPAGTYFHGGAYHTDDINADNVIIGCYIEPGDQGPGQYKGRTIVCGGTDQHNATGFFGGIVGASKSPILRGNLRLRNQDLWTSRPRDITLTLNAVPDSIQRLTVSGDHASGIDVMAWDEGDKHYVIGRHGSTRRRLRILSDLNAETFGRASAQSGGEIVFPYGFWLGRGSVGDARYHGNAAGAPSSGEWARGDILWNRDPSEGSAMGWVCVSGGAPGAWAEIRGVGERTAGAAQAAIADSTGGTRDAMLEAVGDTAASNQAAVINDNFAELHGLLDEVRTTLVGFGLMKGGA